MPLPLDDYCKMTDFANLYIAHLSARRGKRANHAVIAFEMDLAYNLSRLQSSLSDGSYRMSAYEQFTIFEPKERRVFAPRYADRIVQHCLCDNILKPLFEPRLIHDNAACRVGKGTHFSIGRLSSFLREHYKLYGNRGGIDRLVKEQLRVKHYVRYMDDSVLLHPDKNCLCEYLGQMRETVARLGLEFNEKTQIVPIKNGVDYLGFHFYLTDSGQVIRKVAGSKKKALRHRIDRCFSDYERGLLTLADLEQRVTSYDAHLRHGHTFILRGEMHKRFVAYQ